MKVWGVCGWKNSGKTGLVERLVAEFAGRGLAVSTIKHAHSGFDIDRSGTDSARHRQAGAREVLVGSRKRWALMHELGREAEPTLDELLERLGPTDIVLVEGFKSHAHPKIETHRGVNGEDLIAMQNPSIRAIASDTELKIELPVFGLNDTRAIAAFILQEIGL